MISKADLYAASRAHVSPMRHSVIRRASYSIVFFVGGYGFYYLTIMAANIVLSREDFGRFYLGWSMLNILSAPGAVIALFFSVYFAEVFKQAGPRGLTSALNRVMRRLSPWITFAVLGTILLLDLAGSLIGADSFLLIVVLPGAAASFFAVDIVRSALQGMLRFLWFGLSWMASSVAQFVLAVAGLFMIGTPWVGFLAMLVANMAVAGAVLRKIKKFGGDTADGPDAAADTISEPTLRQALPFCAGLGGVVLLHNIDVIAAYLALGDSRFGIYAAAAVLPKAVFAATQPVVQVMLPVMAHVKGAVRDVRSAVIKAGLMILALAAGAAAMLWLLSGVACGGRFGIQFCDPSLMLILAVAVIPVSFLRVLVVADLSEARYWAIAAPVAAIGLFFGTMYLRPFTAADVAGSYMVACFASVGAYATTRAAQRQWRRYRVP